MPLHAYRLVYPDSPPTSETLWEWEAPYLTRLLWTAHTFGRTVVHGPLLHANALAEAHQRIWATDYLLRPSHEPWNTWQGWRAADRTLVTTVQEVSEAPYGQKRADQVRRVLGRARRVCRAPRREHHVLPPRAVWRALHIGRCGLVISRTMGPLQAAETFSWASVAVYCSPNGGATEAVVRERNAAETQGLMPAYAFPSACQSPRGGRHEAPGEDTRGPRQIQ